MIDKELRELAKKLCLPRGRNPSLQEIKEANIKLVRPKPPPAPPK
jgi:hypothetical protein